MNDTKEFICIVCPMGCHLSVRKNGDDYVVSGNSCSRGEAYGKQECISPVRNISTTVRVEHGFLKLCPVKTSAEIPKDKIFDVMRCINAITIDAPVRLGQVIIDNILNTGVDIVATRDIERVC